MTETTTDREGSYELRHYLQVLWRRKLSILVPMVLLAFVGWLLGSGLTTSYTSVAEVQAKPVQTASTVTDTSKDDTTVGDEMALLSSDKVKNAVEDTVGHEVEVEITQENSDSNTITITVTGDEDDVAADAQAYADTYVTVRRAELAQGATTATETLTTRLADVDAQLAVLTPQITAKDAEIVAEIDEIVLRGLNSQRDDLLTQRDVLNSRRGGVQAELDALELTIAVNPTLGIEVLSSASDAEIATGATRIQYASAGLAIGLIIGVLLAFAREHFDQSVRTTRDVEQAGRGVRVLGAVPRHPRGATQ